jgi:hypothetical protein
MKKLMKLALQCANRKWEYDRSKTIENTPIVYKVETDKRILRFWNTTNNNGTILNVARALAYLSEAMVEGNINGTIVTDEDTEVRYEVTKIK